MNGSYHLWISHVAHEWVMPHFNESCHISMSHVTYQWVMSHINESCHISIIYGRYANISRWWSIHWRHDSLICDMTHWCVTWHIDIWQVREYLQMMVSSTFYDYMMDPWNVCPPPHTTNRASDRYFEHSKREYHEPHKDSWDWQDWRLTLEALPPRGGGSAECPKRTRGEWDAGVENKNTQNTQINLNKRKLGEP